MIWNERIKSLRKANGYTLKEIAKLLQVTESTAQRYETNGIKAVPYEIITKYAEIFGCTPAYIMGWEPEKTVTVSPYEEKLLEAFRKAPFEIRIAVQKLLDIEEA